MLARTANGIFWLARYVERMDNLARLLEAAQRMSGLSPQSTDWLSALHATGCEQGYAAKYERVTAAHVVYYLSCDRDNPSSILSSLDRARTNARAVRAALTRDMWDALNGAWLDSQRIDPIFFEPELLPETLDWVKNFTTRFLGAYASTMLRNDVYHFTRMGTFIERADNTARILDVKYHMLLPSFTGVGGLLDYYQWTSILHSVSATRAYHWVYKSEVTPWNIAELLLLRQEMPRSIRSCLDVIDESLKWLAAAYGSQNGAPQRLAGALSAQLRYGVIDDIFQIGLHEYLTQLIERIAKLAVEIERHYMH